MELLTQLLTALWSQDFETLANPGMIGMLYFVLFMILFLENGLLPAAFLPGDSLLVLVGVLIAKGALGYPQTVLLLTAAASLGCWVSYIQGRWLGNTRIVQNGFRICPRIITSGRITCFINTGCQRCCSAVLSPLSARCCRLLPGSLVLITPVSSSLTG